MSCINPKLSIEPSKFTIYDSDLSSTSDTESDFDSDEWVSVSTSSTNSTASSLPKQLVLQPRCQNVSHSFNSLTTVKPATRSNTVLSTVSTTNTRTHAIQPYAVPQSSPITALKATIPNLAAIYLVSPTSMTLTYTQRMYAKPSDPFSSFTLWYPSLINPRPGQPSPPPAIHHNLAIKETYLRVCADCAKPSMTMFCDGTGTVTNASGACELHSWVTKDPSCDSKGDATAESRDGPGGGNENKNIRRDKELFGVVVQAVQPFWRVETEKMGVRVFDMTVENRDTFVHRTTCGCEGRK